MAFLLWLLFDCGDSRNRACSSTHLSLLSSSRPLSSSPPLSIVFGPYCSVPSPPTLFPLQFSRSPRPFHIRTPANLSGQKALFSFKSTPLFGSFSPFVCPVSASWPLVVRFPFLFIQVHTSGRVMLVHCQREKLLLRSDPGALTALVTWYLFLISALRNTVVSLPAVSCIQEYLLHGAFAEEQPEGNQRLPSENVVSKMLACLTPTVRRCKLSVVQITGRPIPPSSRSHSQPRPAGCPSIS